MGINIEMISHNSVVYGGIKSPERKKRKNTFKIRVFRRASATTTTTTAKRKKLKRIIMNYILYCPKWKNDKKNVSRKTNKTFRGFQIQINIYIFLHIYIHVTKIFRWIEDVNAPHRNCNPFASAFLLLLFQLDFNGQIATLSLSISLVIWLRLLFFSSHSQTHKLYKHIIWY